MSDDILTLNSGSGGRNEDVESLTGSGGQSVIRQRLQVTGALLAEIAKVRQGPRTGDYGLVTVPTGSMVDAFGRSRISEPLTIFDSKQLVDNQPLIWDDQQTSGSGTSSTYNANQGSSTLAVSASTAGTRVRQTFRRFNYQPSKSQLAILTGILGTPAAGITRRIGTFDEKNGLFFESSPTTVRIVERSFTSGSAVDTPVAQTAWNLDTLDGNGPSGITLNPAKVQIFVIDFQWLGSGVVRYGFYIGRRLIYCHETDHSNLLTLVYMSIPNLPLRYEIANDGTGGAASLLDICAAVSSEAGHQDTGIARSTHRTAVLTTNNDASLYPLIAIRLGTSFLAASVRILDVSVTCPSAASYAWALLLNPTVTGTALSFTALSNSAVEAQINTTNATTVSGGTELDSGVASSTVQAKGDTSHIQQSSLQLGSTIAGVSDIIVLAAQRITGTTETFLGQVQWSEAI